MYKPTETRFRQDLVITQNTNKKTQAKIYLIQDPATAQTFEFGEEEFFLCQAMDGTSTPQQIMQEFRGRFGVTLSRDDFNDFSDQMISCGLLRRYAEANLPPTTPMAPSIPITPTTPTTYTPPPASYENPPPAPTQHEEAEFIQLPPPASVRQPAVTEAALPLPPARTAALAPLTEDGGGPNFIQKNWRLLLFVLVLGILCSLPYPYRPGGQLTLLPPLQQNVQAPISGKVIQTFYSGGDEQWLKKGTPIAVMESTDLQNNLSTLTEQVNAQESALNKLLNTPRPDEVQAAQEQVNAARDQVAVAQKSLEAGISQAKLSEQQTQRYEQLFKEGAYAEDLYEQARTQAEVDRIKVEGLRSSVEATQKTLAQQEANLRLVRQGPYPQDIEQARAQLAAARQQVTYTKQQLKSASLYMPMEGRIVTPYLNQKVGTYLTLGATYAVVENARNILGELQVPEYDAWLMKKGAKVEIKLLAYSDDPIYGKVRSVEPVAVTQEYGRVVRVLVEVPNSAKTLKQGMSGYAKVEGVTRPVIVAFTQPIIRFVFVEMWSWLP